MVAIPVGAVTLEADVVVPAGSQGIVLFAHGTGSGRHSPRNQFVARELQAGGFATVLADLLTLEEERIDDGTGRLRFDIGLLAGRVIALVDWLVGQETVAGLNIGVFGASTGAAAALIAAAERPAGRRAGRPEGRSGAVAAVVSRGGRPDLARHALASVHQPTLLIVGGRDAIVIDLNRAAMEELPGEKQLEVVPGATHLFEEPGALERVAHLARDWFDRYLASGRGPIWAGGHLS